MENHRRIEMANDKILIVALIVALTAVALILLPIAFNQTHAASLSLSQKKDKDNGDLTIVLKLKYSKLSDSHPEYYDKVRLTIGKYFNEYFNLKKMNSLQVLKLKG
jgi:hypothetical protein